MKCRHCRTPLTSTFVDLGSAPPSNAYLTEADLKKPEIWYPLRVLVCSDCRLVQTDDYTGAADIFTDKYAYFSSYSSSWLQHSERYVAQMVERFGLSNGSFVVELAANDGYLLQFVQARNIPCLGIEPTASTAAIARAKGIEVLEHFFGRSLAEKLASGRRRADLVTANNVLAHVPDINDFVAGVGILLKDGGVATFEFPHLVNLVANNQFDTIYHEHYSYLSLTSVARIFERNGLQVFDVEELPTHGGSLRVYAQRVTGPRAQSPTVTQLLNRECSAGINTDAYYAGFQARADRLKNELLKFLLDAKRDGKSIAGYGAAAKGNTLMNYAGVRPDLMPYVVDRSPSKRGKFMPGSHIPIVSEEQIRQHRPDYVLVLPWNLWDEVTADLSYIRNWGARFVRAVPKLHIQ
jgi:SAM-dependent methyltransferase